MAGHSPKFSLPIFINTAKYLNRIIITMAGLLKYFKPKQRHEDNDDEEKPKGLPDPNGDLSKVVPSSSIEVTNAVVRQALEKEPRRATDHRFNGEWIYRHAS